MSEIPADSIMTYFCDLEDPRSGQNISHPLPAIITIAILGMICGRWSLNWGSSCHLLGCRSQRGYVGERAGH